MLLRLAFVLSILLTSMASKGLCARAMRSNKVSQSLWKDQLPRGPVPPSMPSPCHHKLDPYKQSQLSYPNGDFITCP